MWYNKHYPASPVKTADLAEDPENKQRTVGGLYTWKLCDHSAGWSCENASSSGHKYVPGTRAKHPRLKCHHLKEEVQKFSVQIQGGRRRAQAWIGGAFYHIYLYTLTYTLYTILYTHILYSFWIWELIGFSSLKIDAISL